ncbi:MAG: hypothetical protein AAB483_00075 [Patescibacteria group bacterium]
MQDFKIEPLGGASKLKLPAFTPTLKIILIAAGVLLLAGAGFFLFGRSTFAERNVVLTLNHPGEISSGDRVTYTVRYRNDNRLALTRAKLTFYAPPEAIILKDGNVTTQISDAIDLGTLQKESSGEKTFELLVIGSQGNVKTARVALSYQPEGLTTQLNKTIEGAITISRSPIQLTAIAPPTVLDGQALTYLIDYRNQSQETFANLRVRARIPGGFSVSSAMPKTKDPGEGDWVWDIPTLAPGEGARITIQGTLQGKERESKTLLVNLQRQFDMPAPTGTPADPIYVTLEKAEASSVIATPLLSAQVTVQDATDYTAHLKDNLKYKILVTNNSDVDLSSLTLAAKLEGSMYDLATLESTGAFDSRTNTVFWNSAVIPELGLLRAHQNVTVSLNIRLKGAFPRTIGTKDSLLKFSSHVETANVPDIFQVDTLSADDSLITRISTATSFNHELTVRDGRFGTSGAYPPKVDQKSIFTVRWTIANPSNDVAPAKITAVLLPGVTWENKVQPVGVQVMPTYDAKTNIITWNLGTLPAGVGVAFPAYDLYFQVATTPSVNQVGSTLPLVKDIRFEGTDIITKEKIVNSLSNLSSSDVRDSSESGTVQP